MTELLVLAAVGLVWVFVAPNLGPERPPRHVRPEGWTGPPEPASTPLLAEYPLSGELLRITLTLPTMPGRLSPLNRESMRRRFRVMWWQAQSRPVV